MSASAKTRSSGWRISSKPSKTWKSCVREAAADPPAVRGAAGVNAFGVDWGALGGVVALFGSANHLVRTGPGSGRELPVAPGYARRRVERDPALWSWGGAPDSPDRCPDRSSARSNSPGYRDPERGDSGSLDD